MGTKSKFQARYKNFHVRYLHYLLPLPRARYCTVLGISPQQTTCTPPSYPSSPPPHTRPPVCNMTPTKSRFTHLLVSITIALMLSPTVGALPRQERTRNQSIPPRTLVKLPPDLSTRSTLFCCRERGSGASRARFIRWTEAVSLVQFCFDRVGQHYIDSNV